MGGQWFFVYRFGAIFRGNTAVEPPQNPPWYYGQGRLCPVRLLCFGIVSVFIFAGSLCCRSCPRLWRRFAPLGTLVAVRVPPFPCRKSLRYIAGEHIPYRPVIRLE